MKGNPKRGEAVTAKFLLPPYALVHPPITVHPKPRGGRLRREAAPSSPVTCGVPVGAEEPDAQGGGLWGVGGAPGRALGRRSAFLPAPAASSKAFCGHV